MNKGKKSLFTYLVASTVIIGIIAGCFYVYHQFKTLNDLSHGSFQNKPQLHKKQTAEKAEKLPPLKTVFNPDEPISNQIDQYLKSTQFNGTIAVFKDGRVMMDKGYGYQDFEKGKKNGPNTVYLIGSAQKFLTGIMIKKLEIEKKINVEDSVSRYIPDFQFPQEITIRDLLRHQSGLYKYKGSDSIKNLDEAILAIHKRGIDPLHYHQHFYNDANYIVLAKVIENVTHLSYVENYYRYIGNPFQLMHSAFYNDSRYEKDFAKGYSLNEKTQTLTYREPKYLDQYYGAGNLYMSAHDMGVLVRKLQGNRVFSKNVTMPYLHELLTLRFPEKYRYGFYVYNDKSRINGIFYGQIYTTYFNKKYIVVLGTNYDQPEPNNNEAKIKHIYHDILKQRTPYNQPGITVVPQK